MSLTADTRQAIKDMFLATAMARWEGFEFALSSVVAWMGGPTSATALRTIRGSYFYAVEAIDHQPETGTVSTVCMRGGYKEEGTMQLAAEHIHEYEGKRYVANHMQYVYGRDFIIKTGSFECSTRKEVFMNARAFKLFCMRKDYPMAHIVRDYYLDLETDYIKALSGSPEDNRAELDRLKHRAAELNAALHDAQDRELEHNAAWSSCAMARAELYGAIRGHFRDEDAAMLSILRARMHPVPLFAVDDGEFFYGAEDEDMHYCVGAYDARITDPSESESDRAECTVMYLRFDSQAHYDEAMARLQMYETGDRHSGKKILYTSIDAIDAVVVAAFNLVSNPLSRRRDLLPPEQ